jgi:hypothetical protein
MGVAMVKTPEERIRNIEVRAADLQGRFHELLTRAAKESWATRAVPEERLGPYITISRQAATGGVEIARIVTMRWNWSLLDKEVVEAIAKRLRVSPRMLELMDETGGNWFSDSLLTLLEPRLTMQDSYVSMLRSILLLAAYQGRVVIVGRGGNFLLPREFGLSVRLVAPRESRLARLCQQEGLEPRAAARRLDELDRSRTSFVKRHFHHDPDDPSHYDLIVDSSTFDYEASADLVCRAAELRGLLALRAKRRDLEATAP